MVEDETPDGDTLAAETLYLPFGVALYDVDMRCADFDAWESSFRRTSVSITHAEIERGKRAAKELAELRHEAPPPEHNGQCQTCSAGDLCCEHESMH